MLRLLAFFLTLAIAVPAGARDIWPRVQFIAQSWPTIDLLLDSAFLADGQRQALDVLRPAAAWGDRDTAAVAKALLRSMGQH